MNEQIDKSSPIPYYIQLRELLAAKIEGNEYRDGKLPSENELARRYELTVTTVRKVLQELQNANKIYKVKGVGSFVKKRKLELDIAKYLSFGRIIREKGLTETIEVVKKQVIDFNPKILNGYELKNPSRQIIQIERVRSIGGEPFAIERLFFNNDACGPMVDNGFTGTEAVFEEFLKGLASLPEVRFATIGEFIQEQPPKREAVLDDFLGNTKIETFTEGDAQPLWDLTRKVRAKLLSAEETHPGSPEVEQAWEHLLLSHNSDGRIGYWHSQWNPGEHKVAPSRRAFVEDNLKKALMSLESLG
jgi:DNA-binding GntR family transcriptional regulator